MTPALADRDSLDIFFFPLRPDILPQFSSQLADRVVSWHQTILVLHRGLRAPGGLVRANPGRRFGPRAAGAGQDPAFLGVVSVRVNGGKRQFSGPRIVAGGGGGGRRDCSFST